MYVILSTLTKKKRKRKKIGQLLTFIFLSKYFCQKNCLTIFMRIGCIFFRDLEPRNFQNNEFTFREFEMKRVL